jgi:GTP-binding protein EngB required for normal cell division
MTPVLSARTLTAQLADDLGWLERHCRSRSDRGQAGSRLRLAAALVRNCIGPLLDDQPPTPLHIVVVGGAGAGKSTVANLLSGAAAAEANPQAGFTRHPIAYTSANGPGDWTGHLGFLGPLQRLNGTAPSSLDQDVYQVRRVPPDPTTHGQTRDWVIWDCPDMTTWASLGYVTRLIEAVALADVLIYVASDERYNDEIPTQFLDLLLRTGKPVVCVLTKMKEADVKAMVDHFKRDVLAKLPQGWGVVVPIPAAPPQQLLDPARLMPRYRIELINQVAVLTQPPAAARRRSVAGAMRFLVQNQEQLLASAREDVQALQNWQLAVQSGHVEFDTRYYREYLTSEKYRGFDEAMVRLMQLLELPGVGKVVSGVLYVTRLPFQFLKGLLGKAMGRTDPPGRPEQPVLEEAYTGWLDLLRKEAARNAEAHPLWAHINKGFQSGALGEQAREKFNQCLRAFQVGLAEEVDRCARAIYEELEKKPAVLNTLRVGKLGLETAAIAGTIIAGGLSWWDLLWVPLASGLTNQLVELLGKGYVEAQREATRRRQQELLTRTLSSPLAEWLVQWPASGGSEFGRLQQALRRIPDGLRQLDAQVQAALRR